MTDELLGSREAGHGADRPERAAAPGFVRPSAALWTGVDATERTLLRGEVLVAFGRRAGRRRRIRYGRRGVGDSRP